MREKLAEYAAEGATWPHSAAILDPVRLSIIASGPARIVQVARWFTGHETLPQASLEEAHADHNGCSPPRRATGRNSLGPDDSNLPGAFGPSRAAAATSPSLPVVRVKNKFAFAKEELKGGYRDLMLSVLYEDPEVGLRIIGEIQVPCMRDGSQGRRERGRASEGASEGARELESEGRSDRKAFSLPTLRAPSLR